jgi:hypothetical protein
MVTKYVKLRGGRCRAVTQVKDVSVEIFNVSKADTVFQVASGSSIIDRARLKNHDGV